METDYLFRGTGINSLEEDATITYVRGIGLDNFEGIVGWNSQIGKGFDILFDMLDHCSMGWGPRRWIGSKSIKKEFALLPEILIEI